MDNRRLEYIKALVGPCGSSELSILESGVEFRALVCPNEKENSADLAVGVLPDGRFWVLKLLVNEACGNWLMKLVGYRLSDVYFFLYDV